MRRYSRYVVTHRWGNNPTRDEHESTNGFIVPNDYDHSLASFQDLFEEARKTFPHLREKDVECKTVVESAWCKRCPILVFPIEKKGRWVGWENVPHLPGIAYS